jgi:hypothetical protein
MKLLLGLVGLTCDFECHCAGFALGNCQSCLTAADIRKIHSESKRAYIHTLCQWMSIDVIVAKGAVLGHQGIRDPAPPAIDTDTKVTGIQIVYGNHTQWLKPDRTVLGS